MNRFEESIKEWTKIVNAYLDDDSGYYYRASVRMDARQWEDAVEDFNMSVILNSDNSYAFMLRGDCYRMMGRREQAEEDYQHVLSMEEESGERDRSPYALVELG